MTKIAVIYGSSRPSKAGEAVANWFVGQVKPAENVEFEMIDLAELNLPMFAEMKPPMMGEYEADSTKDWAEKVASYDGFIFVVAEYNLGYTPILKNAIDTLFAEWKDKPAGLISYGAYPKSTAVEQLRTVLSAFKMKLADSTVHVTPVFEAIGSDGSVTSDKVVGSAQAVADEVFAALD